MNRKIRVAWICDFSNEKIREKITIHIGIVRNLIWKFKKNQCQALQTDKGVWNTNAFREFEKRDDVELHVIAPCPLLKQRKQDFILDGIHYYFYRDESTNLLRTLYRQIIKPKYYHYRSNRRIVKGLIKRIAPDVVHLIGAENPHYSLCLLDIQKSVPTIVQLQTLMNDPNFFGNYPIDEQSYRYRSSVEKSVILRADYIGTRAKKFISIIRDSIKPDIRLINTTLAVGEDIQEEQVKKQFDFVYFASNINKAGDLALEAFGKAFQIHPNISMDIIGGYDNEFKHALDIIIKKYDIGDAVTFEGRLKTHDDVLEQIRKSRYALLPLRIDLISGCIREAMSNGLPVITTDTGELGTQMLNKDYECALISSKDDTDALAKNMLILLNDANVADRLRNNGLKRQLERYDNSRVVDEYIDAYKKCLTEKR